MIATQENLQTKNFKLLKVTTKPTKFTISSRGRYIKNNYLDNDKKSVS